MMSIQEKIGRRIRELRKQTGLSQEKFALSIEMDRTYLSSVEAGKRNLSVGNLEKIINGLHITFEAFFQDWSQRQC